MTEEQKSMWMEYYMSMDKDELCRRLLEAEEMFQKSVSLISGMALEWVHQMERDRDRDIENMKKNLKNQKP